MADYAEDANARLNECREYASVAARLPYWRYTISGLYLIAAAYMLMNYHRQIKGANLVLLISWAISAVLHILWTYFLQRGITYEWLSIVSIYAWHLVNHIIFLVVVLSLKFILINMEGKNKTYEEV